MRLWYRSANRADWETQFNSTYQKRQAELAARCRRLTIIDMILIALTTEYPVKEVRKAKLRNEVDSLTPVLVARQELY
jgi:hypothetical protein